MKTIPLVAASLLATALCAQGDKAAPAIKLQPATVSGAGQEVDQETLIAKRDEKLKKEFLKKADWLLDYDRARAEAKKTGKVLLVYFTRSYAP
jgi:hypothetical protein